MSAKSITKDYLSAGEIPSGRMFLFLGAVISIIGAVASANLFLVTMAATVVIEVSMFAAGIMILVYAFVASRRSLVRAWLLLGVLYVGVSVWLFLNPEIAVRVLTLGLAVLMFLSGGARLAIGSFGHRIGRLWLVLSGLVGMLAGLAIAWGWPVDAIWVLGLVVAVDLILYGFALMVTGFLAAAERRKVSSLPPEKLID